MFIYERYTKFIPFNTIFSMLFSEVIGQDVVKSNLLNLTRSGRVGHAYLFTGSSGSGAFQLALAFAQQLCCEQPNIDDACGTCRSCRQFSRLTYPDMLFVFPYVKADSTDDRTCVDYVERFREMILSKTFFTLEDWHNVLGVETKQSVIYEVESDAIITFSALKPYYDKYKVVFMWLPERMNATCANKILKILEEPFPNTLFLLVSEQPELLLPTILSRVQIVSVPPLTEEAVAQAIRTTNTSLPSEHVQEIAHLCEGNYLKVQNLLSPTSTDTTFFEWFKTLMRAAWSVGIKQDYKALVSLRKWSIEVADGKNSRDKIITFLQYCQRSIREYYIYNYGNPTINYLSSDESSFAQNFAQFINDKNVEGFMLLFASSEDAIRQNGNMKVVLFDLALNTIVLIRQR